MTTTRNRQPRLRYRSVTGAAVVAVSGDLTVRRAEVSRQWRDLPIRNDERVIVVDLSRIRHVTTGGVDALLDVLVALHHRGHEIRLVDPQPLVRMTLFLAGIPPWAAMYHDLPAALAGEDRIDDAAVL